MSDANFACPALQVDRWTSEYAPTFGYEFDDSNAPERFAKGLPPAATHSSEIQYIFDQPNAPLPGTFTPDQQMLAASMRAAWASFAANGDPSTPALAWPSFNQGEQVMSLVPPAPQVWTGFSDAHHCGFWAAVRGHGKPLNHPSKETPMSTTEQTPAGSELLPNSGVRLSEGYAEIGDVKLHYVEAGDGPLIVLLHGFPEFWFGWRLQIAPLAAAGFRVVAPDTRGYNLSSKPEGFKDYGVDLLAADIRGLIDERGAESALLVGHDWGGSIAWTVAMNHPEVVDRLAILNAAHPRRLSEGLHHPSQLRKSWYFFFFATPGLPEDVVHARDWHFFRHFLEDANPPYTPQEIERYIEAWSQPGASAAMINYYRASVRQSQKEAAAKLRPISAPTLVIWGERDSYLGSDLAEPTHDDVPNLDRVERLPDASHWVHHDEAERVNQLLIEFFAPGGVTDPQRPAA